MLLYAHLGRLTTGDSTLQAGRQIACIEARNPGLPIDNLTTLNYTRSNAKGCAQAGLLHANRLIHAECVGYRLPMRADESSCAQRGLTEILHSREKEN